MKKENVLGFVVIQNDENVYDIHREEQEYCRQLEGTKEECTLIAILEYAAERLERKAAHEVLYFIDDHPFARKIIQYRVKMYTALGYTLESYLTAKTLKDMLVQLEEYHADKKVRDCFEMLKG